MSPFQAIDFKKWIEENRHLLKPPIGNKVIWKDHEFIVMAVGGPNERTDFHVNQGDEFFFQYEGKMTLRVLDPDGHIKDVHIKAGDIYLLPKNTPHSPQREAGSIGLVLERQRRENEIDGLQWYCEKCETKLYEEFFKLTNIETQFQAVFERYYNSDHINCKKCHHANGRKWSIWKSNA
ncbi:MAG: 3-hydroxyanthranilate 3,4-dioxygenase [Oligoflexia bacterium]|nr:3-hydroxyanthranilate 3,4-dioxygenase [Oligoflexia bacterium]